MLKHLQENNWTIYVTTTLLSLGVAYFLKKLFSTIKPQRKASKLVGLVNEESACDGVAIENEESSVTKCDDDHTKLYSKVVSNNCKIPGKLMNEPQKKDSFLTSTHQILPSGSLMPKILHSDSSTPKILPSVSSMPDILPSVFSEQEILPSEPPVPEVLLSVSSTPAEILSFMSPTSAEILPSVASTTAEILPSVASTTAEILPSVSSTPAEIAHSVSSTPAEILPSVSSTSAEILPSESPPFDQEILHSEIPINIEVIEHEPELPDNKAFVEQKKEVVLQAPIIQSQTNKMHLSTFPLNTSVLPKNFSMEAMDESSLVKCEIAVPYIVHPQITMQEVGTKLSVGEENAILSEGLSEKTDNFICLTNSNTDEFPLDAIPLEMIYKILPMNQR